MNDRGDAGDALHAMLVRDLAVLDPPPPGAKLQGKPVWALSEHMQKVFRARYDGTAATIQQLAAELGISRVQVIEWATQLGIRNRVQPGTVVRHVFPAYPAIPEDGDGESDSDETTDDVEQDEDGEGGEIVDADVIEAVLDETPEEPVTPAEAKRPAERERPCRRCHKVQPFSAFDSLMAKICTECRMKAEREPAAKPTPAATPTPATVEALSAVMPIVLTSPSTAPVQHVTPSAVQSAPVVPPLLLSVLEHLPSERVWTSAQRERWLRAFTSSLDLLIDLREQHDGQGAA